MSAPELPKVLTSRLVVGLFWLLLLASLTLFFNGFVERRDNPNLDLRVTPADAQEVVLKRNRYGHYVAPGMINGHPVTFLLDTGATNVSIPANVAQEIGLKRGYRSQVSTANGVISVFQAEIDSVQLGGITLYDVRGHINPNDDEMVLLGMSFMKHLELIQRGDTLTLRQPAS